MALFGKGLLAAVSVVALFAAGQIAASNHTGSGSSSAQNGPGTSGQQFGKPGSSDGSGGSGGSGGGHDDGHDDSHDSGHEDGHDDEHGGDNGGGGHDTIGPGGSGAGKGQGGAGQGSGGSPVWAQEGIPEIELGRLNVARSPTQVLDRAFAEATSTFTPAMANFYNLSVDDMVTELSLNWGNVELVDSPLQNLALFRDALDGQSVLRTLGVRNTNDTLLAAFLGTASDKTIPVRPETAYAVAIILGMPISASSATDIAADAERIRIAILAGHG